MLILLSEKYLKPTFFIDSDSEIVINLAKKLTNDIGQDLERVKVLYEYVRDEILYTIDNFQITNPSGYKASEIIQEKRGFCITKSILLIALLRSINIPARLHFADIINHRSPDHLQKIMGTKVFIYHGYVEFYLANTWVKLNPAFNKALVEKHNLPLCEFDGMNDVIYAPYDDNGNLFVEYVKDRGVSADLAFEEIRNTMEEFYSQTMKTHFSNSD